MIQVIVQLQVEGRWIDGVVLRECHPGQSQGRHQRKQGRQAHSLTH